MRESRQDLGIAAVVLAWISVVLVADHFSSYFEQCLLGVGTWLLLIGMLSRESSRTRAQVAVVVAFATCVEYTFSGWLHVYVYRLHDVPWFVPPGHGLVYLGALAIGRSAVVVRHRRPLLVGTALLATGYAVWGLTFSGRLDVLGACWAGCLLVFLRWGRQPTVFIGAFIVVTYLELFGTHIGAWRWDVQDPIIHLVPMGNPPSGAAGGYGFFDLAALLATDAWANRRARNASGIQESQHLVVQQTVGTQDVAGAGVGSAG